MNEKQQLLVAALLVLVPVVMCECFKGVCYGNERKLLCSVIRDHLPRLYSQILRLDVWITYILVNF